MSSIPTAAQYPKDMLFIWNDTKQRREIWHRCGSGERDWTLYHAWPCRKILESFVGPASFVPAILGENFDRAWDTNGNPAPVAGNFVAANAIGGGVLLRSLGAAADDWVAMHTGPNYPVTIAEAPHWHIKLGSLETAGVYMLVGLVGADNLETGDGSAWTLPDDGIWVEYDTDVDTNFRFVTRKDGAQTSTSLGAIPAGHSSFNFRVTDSQVECIFNGSIVATHITHLPTDQLKPLSMVGSRAGGAAAKDYCLHDFRLIYDHGGV